MRHKYGAKRAKGRHAHGERAGGARLTRSDVIDIRRLRRDGRPLEDIARMFRISFQHVSDIALRRKWAHVS